MKRSDKEVSGTFYFKPERTSLPLRSAFTLLEVMVVVVIIGLLAGLITVNVRSYMILGRQNAAKTEISTMADALNTYYALHNRYPTNEEGLEALVEKTPKFPDGLLSKSYVPKDPWGNDYVYNCPGRTTQGRTLPFEIISYGADGREGGEGENADIISGEF